MKRLLTLLLSASLVASLSCAALAATDTRSAELAFRDIKITLNGKAIKTSAEPFIIEGTTYLPVRAVADALGLSVGWDGDTHTVILSEQFEQPEEKQVYITRTGSKYHYDKSCNGGTYWPVSLETAKGFELAPCEKCVLTSANTASSAAPTIGQTNALKSAQQYLKVMPMSRERLIKQLVHDKYSEADATYAADACGADWKEQAAKSAKKYLDIMAMSRDRLIQQLEHDGFTSEEAVYGVEQAGY